MSNLITQGFLIDEFLHEKGDHFVSYKIPHNIKIDVDEQRLKEMFPGEIRNVDIEYFIYLAQGYNQTAPAYTLITIYLTQKVPVHNSKGEVIMFRYE